MRWSELCRALAGGVVVYVVMAACSSGGAENQRAGNTAQNTGGARDAGAQDAPASGGETGAGGVMAELDAMVDAMVDPVPDAMAQPTTAPEAVEKDCSEVVEINGYTYAYAEQLYPGKSVAELAHIAVFGRPVDLEQAGSALPEGYEWRGVYIATAIRDGAVMGFCGGGSGAEPAIYASKVLFVSPAGF